MNAEGRQRTMDFILQQPVKFTTDLEMSEPHVTGLERVLKLARRAGLPQRGDFRERHAALQDAQIRTEDATCGQPFSAITKR